MSVCPEIAAICFSEQPASAKRRQAALRRPCGVQSGSPARSHKSRILLPSPPGVNGLPYAETKNVRLLVGVAIQDLGKPRVQRDLDVLAGFLLADRDHAAAGTPVDTEVLTPQLHRIRATLRGEEHDRERQSCRRTNGIFRLKGGNLIISPSVKAGLWIVALFCDRAASPAPPDYLLAALASPLTRTAS